MGDNWVVDSLVGFLQSPVWKCPVNSFIEQNCVVFDNGDESNFSHTDIHGQYQSIVEKLLEDFTADLGITSEQLAEACSQSSNLGEEHQQVINQLLAAEDFVLFKSVMVQKNIDLELQALALLQKQLGHSPEAYVPSSSSSKPGESEKKTLEDEKILCEVLEISKKEYDLEQSLDEEELEKLITMAKQESTRLFQAAKKEQELLTKNLEKMSVSPAGVETTCSTSTSSMKVEPSDSMESSSQRDTDFPTLPNVGSPSKGREQEPLQPVVVSAKTTEDGGGVSSSEAAAQWLQSAKAELSNPGSTQSPSDNTMKKKVAVELPDDLKAREKYLRRQRDRLLEMKRTARDKELDTFRATRPKSSHAVPTTTTSQEGKNKHKETSAKDDKSGIGDGHMQHTDRKPDEGKRKQRGSNTGILCSAIAGKLKNKQFQV